MTIRSILTSILTVEKRNNVSIIDIVYLFSEEVTDTVVTYYRLFLPYLCRIVVILLMTQYCVIRIYCVVIPIYVLTSIEMTSI